MTDQSPIIIQTTVPITMDITPLCNDLLTASLAACIQKIPAIESHYTWNDTIQHDQETLICIKTQSRHFSAIETIIRNHHPYDVPEIIELPITTLSHDYGKWLSDSVSKNSKN